MLNHAVWEAQMRAADKIFAVLAPLAMGLVFLQVVLAISIAWVGAFVGDTEMIAYLMDRDPFPAPEVWKMIVGVIASCALAAAVGVLAWHLHRLIRVARRGGLASVGAGRAMRRAGWALIALWLAALFLEFIYPLVLFGLSEAEPEWVLDIVNLDILLAVVGAVMIALARLSEEAMALRAENEQFV